MPMSDDESNSIVPPHKSQRGAYKAHPIISEPLFLPHEEGEADAEAQAREMVRQLLNKAKDTVEQGKALSREPSHPLYEPLIRWMLAIEKHNVFAAEAAAQEVAQKMPMYSRRPAFSIPWGKLLHSPVLARENLSWLNELLQRTQE